ncbi:SusC/RagA family TonB-linked outer membrane protein [Pedobacter yulinensis]|nr:SusC/RagA family TonB-linked outer membrane protein [Pedobacter yulinensis]
MLIKLTCVIVFLSCFHVSAAVFSQDKISLDLKNTKLSKVLKIIEKQSIYHFVYSSTYVPVDKDITLKVDQTPITDVLATILKNTNLGYAVSDGGLIVITRADLITRDVVVKGSVRDATGQPLAGASILVKGSRQGTSADASGSFSLSVPENATLVISYAGYMSREIVVGSQRTLSIVLEEDPQQLGEVVVTALGIKKEKRSLGYSVTEVNGSDLNQARELNVANSLVGKVAGLNVNSVSGGPGASTNILIRGNASLSGDNQPLFVVNGIPINNVRSGNTGGQYDNSPDMGDGISNISPDDIESMSVLKGAAAAALYGSRAKNGVILITTKSGAKGAGQIEFNSNYVSEQIMDLTNWQYVYGNGANGVKPTTAAAAFNAGNASYGARLDGSSVVQFDGVARPYVAQKDNMENFYREGGTFTNTLSFSKGFDGGSVRFSASNLDNHSVVPNSGLKRQNFNFAGNFNASPRVTIDARVNYVIDKAENRPVLADGAGNANFQVMFLPSSLDVNTLKPGTRPDGSELLFTNNNYATNPWFATDKFVNNTDRNRLIASASARYTFENGLFGQIRMGQDIYKDRYTGVVPNGAGYYAQAPWNIQERFATVSEWNADVLIGKTFKAGNDLTITPNVGANLRKSRAETNTEFGTGFLVPYVYNIMNAASKSITYTDLKQEVQSVYGTVELNYKGYLYLNASGRNDWFSALAPSSELGIFYPAVSGSFVFSELAQPSWLSFGKLRAGYARVGSGVDPYQTLLNYGLFSPQLNGKPLGNIVNVAIPNSALRPSEASELEIGTELRFLKDRISLDLAWYNKKSRNEIVAAPASITSGYTGVYLNIGEIENKGVEMLLTGQPVKSAGLTWTSSFNASLNNNKVLTLAAGQSQLAVAISRTGNGFTRNIVGLPSNQIMAFDYKYDASGNIVRDASGIPVQGELVPYGSAYHKYTAGWNNEFSYHNFNLAFLIDGKFGGKIFSATDYYGYFNGLHQATLEGRESGFGPSGATNANTYYSTMVQRVSSMLVQDASFIKFRQVVLGYNFPAKYFNNHIKGLNLSFVARNLFILMKKTENIDPESSYAGITQGLELGGVPPVRTFGFNLNVKF